MSRVRPKMSSLSVYGRAPIDLRAWSRNASYLRGRFPSDAAKCRWSDRRFLWSNLALLERRRGRVQHLRTRWWRRRTASRSLSGSQDRDRYGNSGAAGNRGVPRGSEHSYLCTRERGSDDRHSSRRQDPSFPAQQFSTQHQTQADDREKMLAALGLLASNSLSMSHYQNQSAAPSHLLCRPPVKVRDLGGAARLRRSKSAADIDDRPRLPRHRDAIGDPPERTRIASLVYRLCTTSQK